MDQGIEPKSKTGEEKSISGGRGYAKRSDEEGYGPEYGGNQSLPDEDEDKIVHGNAPEYDPSERSNSGSEKRDGDQSRATPWN